MFHRQYVKIANSSRILLRNHVSNRPHIHVANFNGSNIILRCVSGSAYRFTDKTLKKHISADTQVDKFRRENLKVSPLTSEDILEKFIASLNTDIYQKNRVYKNDLMKVLTKVKEFNFTTKKQGLLLIRCCGDLLPDEPYNSRMLLVEDVWNSIKPHTTFDVDHYNELLKVYIANKRTLTVSTFVNQMAPVKPNITTYELMLKALGEAGDLNQATEVIANMKVQGLPATENMFLSLIICQGKTGNVQSIQEVMTMMKSLKLDTTADTYTASVRAFAFNKRQKQILEEMERARKSGLQFTEVHIMEIVKTLAEVGLHQIIPQVLGYLPAETLNYPSISPYMQSITTQLVFQNQPIAALEIYKCLPLPSFGPKDDQGLHGRSLVRDCVKASMPSNVIGLITQELMASGRNPIALQNATEAALQLGKVPLALDLLSRMKQMGIPIRSHYFWPMLLQNCKSYGEKGIMNILSSMVQMDVKPDYETILLYTLPYVSFTSPQNLMKKFVEAGLTVSMVLTPMMETLLNTGQVRAASEICELFQGKVDAEKLLKPLIKGYQLSSDVKSTIYTLEDICKRASEKNKDWVGRFLCKFFQNKKTKEDMVDVLDLLKGFKGTSIKISTIAADFCLSRIPEKLPEQTAEAIRMCIVDMTDDRIVDDGDIFDQQIPHPKQMNEEALRSHLNELEAKGMNTRGVLRKLLQQYCRDGNLSAAREIAKKCQKEGVFLSAGMKAAIFDLHVKLGELDLAELALADLNKSSPNFTLDEFKVIDFATLMVYSKRISQACDLIHEQSKKRNVVGGRSIAMNCWRLLDATAANGTPKEVYDMFDLLTSYKYCKPSNVMLGPLIRVHLKNDNIHEALNEFTRIAQKYNKTPLKHELLCKIMSEMSDGQSEDNFLTNEKADGGLNKLAQQVLSINKRVHGVADVQVNVEQSEDNFLSNEKADVGLNRLAQQVLNINKLVHGMADVQLTLIAALAEVGYKKTLRKLFLDPTLKVHPDALIRRCERFADERKVEAIENIAECAKDLRHIDVEEIYDMILDVYQRDDNCVKALALWTKMQEMDVNPSPKFAKNLSSLLKMNNKDVPSDLAVLLHRHEKKVSKS